MDNNNNNLKDLLGGKLPESDSAEPMGAGEFVPIPAPVGAMPVIPVEAGTSFPAVSDTNYIAFKNNTLDIIHENFKGQSLSLALFDVIKSPSGGGTAFAVPGLSGDEMVKELTGIILSYTMPRAYWDTPDPVVGTPPVCYSQDSVVSSDGKPCHGCMYNEFGTADNGDGAGKACKEMVEIVLLRPDNIMPVIVRVPVSSKQTFQKYLMRLVGRMVPLSGVVTKITLEKAVNGTGQPYSLYNFEAVNQLSSEESATAKAFGQKFSEMLSAADDVIAEAE